MPQEIILGHERIWMSQTFMTHTRQDPGVWDVKTLLKTSFFDAFDPFSEHGTLTKLQLVQAQIHNTSKRRSL
jgi:hypothetical protein